MSLLPDFTSSLGTVGVELEWQLIDKNTFNLATCAPDILKSLNREKHMGLFKPEITTGMIEYNSEVHTHYPSLLHELTHTRDLIKQQLDQFNIGICGGGSHPFQRWQEQHISPTTEFISDYLKYAYLAKQYTVFGQHIHIGCENGDEAIYLCHALTRYLPQLIALAASSPFYQEIDTRFDSARLNTVSSFPLSGIMPWIQNWRDFKKYYATLHKLNLISNSKDFFWDVRPNPELSTIEIRVCDCPLQIETAALLSFYCLMITNFLRDNKPKLSQKLHIIYSSNRFNASRFGLNAAYVDGDNDETISLRHDILATCNKLLPYAKSLKCEAVLNKVVAAAQQKLNDAYFLREIYRKSGSLKDVVQTQVNTWLK